MSYPAQSLVDQVESVLTGVNIYQTPTANLNVPALVIRPDEPWIEPDSYCLDRERYVAIGVVQAASPESGIKKLHDMAKAIIGAITEPWEFVSVGAPIIDESTGAAFLAAPIRLSYRSSES